MSSFDFVLLQYRVPDGDRDNAKRAIEAARFGWKESRNPIYPWIAYKECRAAGLTVPDWVLEYLDRAADGIWNLCADPPKKNKIAPAVAEALQIKQDGAGSVFSRFNDAKWVILAGYVELYIRQGDKEYLAVPEVAARHNVSPATVWRAWRRYQACVKKSMTS